MRKIYRNGDWNLVLISKEEYKEAIKKSEILKHGNSFTFAEGEATGHCHTAIVPKPEDMTFHKLPNGSYLVNFTEKAILTHPQHSTLEILPSYYRLYKRREKDWFMLAIRKIQD